MADARPREGADQRLRQREARRLDDDVLRRGIAREQRLDGRQEFVGDRAADAAVGEFHDLLRPAVVVAIGDQRAVEAHVAEFVDDDGDAPAFRLRDQAADQRRLAGAEEAGDDRRGECGRARSYGHFAVRLFGLEDERQPRRDEHDAVDDRGDALIDDAKRIGEAAGERIAGDDAEADLAADQHDRPGDPRQRFEQSGRSPLPPNARQPSGWRPTASGNRPARENLRRFRGQAHRQDRAAPRPCAIPPRDGRGGGRCVRASRHRRTRLSPDRRATARSR